MKKNTQLITFIIFNILLVLNFSCSKNKIHQDELALNEGTISISMMGVSTINKIKASNQDKIIDNKNIGYTTFDYEDYSIVSTIIDENINNNNYINPNSDNISNKSNTSKSRYENLPNGIKYKVYIFDGDKYVTSSTFTTGSNGYIENLDITKKYNWTAISYSSTSEIPLESEKTFLITPKHRDVLFTKGTIDLTKSRKIEVRFEHLLSRISIELNTIGVYGEMESFRLVPVNINPEDPNSFNTFKLYQGHLNILTGELEPLENFYLPELNFKQIDPNYKDAYVAHTYSAKLGSTNVTLNLSNIVVRDSHTPLVSRTYRQADNPGSSQQIRYNVSNDPRQSKRLILNIIQSSLSTNIRKEQTETTNNHIIRWSRANLFYKGALGKRSYSVYANNVKSNDLNSFFAYNTQLPNTLNNIDNSGDPCELLHPARFWRLPTKNELSELTNNFINNGTATPLIQNIDYSTVVSKITEINSLENIDAVISFQNNNNLFKNLLENNSDYSPITSNETINFGEYEPTNSIKSGTNIFGPYNNANNQLRFYYNGVYQINNNSREHLYDNKIAAFWTKDESVGYLGFQVGNSEAFKNHKSLTVSNTPNNILKNIRCVRSSVSTVDNNNSYHPDYND